MAVHADEPVVHGGGAAHGRHWGKRAAFASGVGENL